MVTSHQNGQAGGYTGYCGGRVEEFGKQFSFVIVISVQKKLHICLVCYGASVKNWMHTNMHIYIQTVFSLTSKGKVMDRCDSSHFTPTVKWQMHTKFYACAPRVCLAKVQF